MAKQKIETSIEINGIDVVAYPLVESDHVTFENGMSINEMIKGDVSTPVVTHEEISFKVGKGDSDVSSSIVDSSVGEMIIKGQTYQNILPEPSLRNSMSKGKTMQKFNEGYNNVNVVDGVGKSAIVKGQTLVNIMQGNMRLNCGDSSRFSDIVSRPNYLSAKISSSLVGTWTYVSCKIDLRLLKPNAKYFVKFEQLSGIHNGMSIGVRRGDGQKSLTDNVKAKSSVILTALSQLEIDNQVLYIGIPSSTPVGTTIVVSNPILIEYQEGMENWDIPYFEGMTSVKSPSLMSIGKNLFDKNTAFSGWVDNETGVITKKDIGVGDNIVSDYIKIVSTKTYTMNTSVYQWYYTKDKKYINNPVSVGTNLTPPDNAKYVILAKSISNQNSEFYSILNSMQLEEGSAPTTYEPHKSNALLTPENVFLRSVENTQDTLNLNTGEHIQRIGEVTLNGNEAWEVLDNNTTDTIGFTLRKVLPLKKTGDKYVRVNCDKLPSYKHNLWNQDKIGCVAENNINQDLNDTQLQVRVLKSSLKTVTAQGFKEWLQANPITIQYILETPIVKTVALSSSGNWEKVVLDGNQNWSESYRGWSNKVFCLNNKHTPNIATQGTTATTLISNDILATNIAWLCEEKGRTGIATHEWAVDYLQIAINGIETTDQLKSHLSQNPVTVWYQTATHQDSTQVKQPLSFSNGHVQLSSKEGSLIPSLDYEVPTSNSYHMDLMKPSTVYTMKSSSHNGGHVYIDGKDYTMGSNRQFTSPSSMTNKLLVVDGVIRDLMILEGNLTSKTIPYFKGIKSAFEGEDKIEVLSTNHNLWTGVDNYTNNGAILAFKGENECVFEHRGVNEGIGVNVSDYEFQVITMSYDFEILDGKALNVGGHNRHQTKAYYIDGVKTNVNYHNGYVATYEKNRVYHVDHVVHIDLPFAGGSHYGDRRYIGIEPNRYSGDTPTYCKMRVTNFQITLGDTIKGYTPPKSNITKIPLPSPLRSLPNGVRDEVILDRENNKVKVIQRVGDIFVNGSEKWNNMEITTPTNYVLLADNRIKCGNDRHFNNVSSSFPVQSSYDRSKENCYVAYKNQLIFTPFTERFRNLQEFKQWLSQNPTTVYYELETPIITEIDLEGFPYVYKDGHIFLNSEIAPTTTMKYSINQSHQIASQNGDLIRHEKEINYLYTLIAKYVNVQYESTLLNLDLELSRA